MSEPRNDDQAIHPSEQDGLISGAWLDRQYDADWWATKRLSDEAWLVTFGYGLSA